MVIIPWQLINSTNTLTCTMCQEIFKWDRSSSDLHYTDANPSVCLCCEEYDVLFQVSSNLQSSEKNKKTIPSSTLWGKQGIQSTHTNMVKFYIERKNTYIYTHTYKGEYIKESEINRKI